VDDPNALLWWLSPDGQQQWGPYSGAQVAQMLATTRSPPRSTPASRT
jgi:hypothetical protein